MGTKDPLEIPYHVNTLVVNMANYLVDNDAISLSILWLISIHVSNFMYNKLPIQPYYISLQILYLSSRIVEWFLLSILKFSIIEYN